MTMQTRKMWVLVDKNCEFRTVDQQLHEAIDGALYDTKPIPARRWLKPMRVVVTIEPVERRAIAAKAATQSSGRVRRERVAQD